MQLWEEKIIARNAAYAEDFKMGLEEVREARRAEAREEGRAEILQLIQSLIRDGRAVDIERLSTDIAFYQKLLEEYKKKE